MNSIIEDDYSIARQLLVLQLAKKLPQLNNDTHRSLAEFILRNNLCTEPPEMNEKWVEREIEYVCCIYEEAQKNNELPVLKYSKTYRRGTYSHTEYDEIPIINMENYQDN